MKLLAGLRSRFSTVPHESRIQQEMDEELRSHLLHRADDLERAGLSRAEAERLARVEFGGYGKYREQGREAVGGQWLEVLWQDIRFGCRTLRKSPGFTVAAAATLALAIGANAVVFSMLNGLVLRPLNLLGASELYTIERGADRSPMQSYPDYKDLRDRNQSFAGMVAYDIQPAALDTGGHAVSAWVNEASGNYFDVLGVQPYLGRFFHASDEHGPNSAPYIVLSYGYWQSQFQADPGVAGRTVQVNHHPFTVLGVAPEAFHGTELFMTPAFWVPMVDTEEVSGGSYLHERLSRNIWMVGRVRPGVTPTQATADLNAVGAYLAQTYPREDGATVFALARPGLIGDMLGGPVRAFMTGLMVLAGLILLAACANLGSLFAARAADRAREVALRLALGSSRKRILRQLLTEALLVSLAGGSLGLAGAVALLRWLSAWQPIGDIPIRVPVDPDIRVYAAALLLALASGLMIGLVPVRQVMRSDPYQVVKMGASGAHGRRFTLRDVLLVVQIAVCALLVTASLVAVRGLVRSLHSNFGFEPKNVLLVNTDLDMAGYSGDRVAQMQRRLGDEMAAIPGVKTAGLSDNLPLSLGWSTDTIFEDSQTDLRTSNVRAEAVNYDVSPKYFQAAGTGLIAGREFTLHDDQNAPRVAVVNRAFVRQVLRLRNGDEASAVGRFFKLNRGAQGTRVQVVGVVEDGKYRTITEDEQAAMFQPILQSPSSATWLVLRINDELARNPQPLVAAVDGRLRELDPGLPFKVHSWQTELNSALFASRVASVSLGVLGVMGGMLSITGIFGMAAYAVSKRLRELGIRMALGAQRREVLQAALGRPVLLLAAGSVLGLTLGLLATRLLASIVYQATPRDPLVLGGVVLAMLLLGVVATWIPAQRALSVNPVKLLRED